MKTGKTGDYDPDASIRDEQRRLKQLLREMPDRRPPAGLTDAVLRSLQPKRLSVRRRIKRWLLTPRRVSFRPAILLPATATAVLLLLVGSWTLFETFHGPETGLKATASVAIVFTLRQPQAESVSLIGSFNRWNPSGYALRHNAEKSLWSLEIELEPGRYEYAFLVDGKTILLDPQALFQRDDGFGSKNSILLVTEENGQTI